MTHYRSNNGSGWCADKVFSLDEPSVCIMEGGMGGDNLTHWEIVEDGHPARPVIHQDKPPYRVPSMADITAIPPNGLKVVSTFAGAGGSSTGYRMAGFKVLWANEFIADAADTYAANMVAGTIVDRRDIKQIDPAEILAATGLQPGELDVFDGSPPCQAFSTAGKRQKLWGKERHYDNGAAQCNENLFFDYIRFLKVLKPKSFIAENVSGLVKGVAKGFFLEITSMLKEAGYRVESRLLDAQWLGVPQMRQRLIFMGIRDDLDRQPRFPRPLPYRYSIREAVPWLSGQRVIEGDTNGHSSHRGAQVPINGPVQSILAGGDGGAAQFFVEPYPTVTNYVGGHSSMRNETVPTHEPAPTIMAIDSGGPQFYVFDDAYEKSKVLRSADRPSRTIRSGHDVRIGKIERDSDVTKEWSERRKFTIDEVKQLCAFPPDFQMTGSYKQQWGQLGNAVPPVMMAHIASALREVLQ